MRRRIPPTFRPQLRRGFRIAPADQGRWQVRWDFDEIAFLEGSACGRVLPWLTSQLDGIRTIAELEQHAALSGQLADLHAVLERLIEEGFIDCVDGNDPTETDLLSGLELTSCEIESALQHLEHARVLVCGHSPLAERVALSVSAQGIQHTSIARDRESVASMIAGGKDADDVLPVVIETDWTPDMPEVVNDWSLASGRPWMLLGAWNRRILAGPIFVPQQTSCYECYRKRLDSHRAHLTAYQILESWRRSQTEAWDPEPILPGIVELAAAWTALELFAYFSGARPSRILGRVLVYRPVDAQLSFEPVLRIPWCSRCSTDASGLATQ